MSAQPISVEVDIMSGVPNPAWIMTTADAANVSALVTSWEPDTSSEQLADLGLGFRGFVLRSVDAGELGSYDEVRVLGAKIIASNGTARSVVLRDPGLSVYESLRTMSQHHLAANVFAQIPLDGVRGA